MSVARPIYRDFHLSDDEGLSLALGSTSRGTGDVTLAYGQLRCIGILDLGPGNLGGVREVPDFPTLGETTSPIKLLGSAFSTVLSGGELPKGYRAVATPFPGHVYAVKLGSSGPFAAIEVTEVTTSEGFQHDALSVSGRYAFQSTGGRRFN